VTRYSLVGELPRHLYVYVDSVFTHTEPQGLIPAVWFGLVSYPGRTWGCTVMLESGAVYRNLPPHAIAFTGDAVPTWMPEDAQTWDCYGEGFSCLEYRYLSGLRVKAKADGSVYEGEYLFSVAPIGDGFSAVPEQAKEFMFLMLDNGRLTIQPTDKVIFQERSFTDNDSWDFPVGLRRQTEVWSCEVK
jgi:hypothetical protein